MSGYDWTSPICEDRWWQDYGMGGRRDPSRLTAEAREVERCVFCGRETTSGIYVRVDPATVPFPKLEEQP
jgi:hypothetical protein